MKVFLDDERKTPEGWERTYTPQETINWLKTGTVTHLSLDHDLGDDERIGTGYDVVLWLEETCYKNKNFKLPEATIHSANNSASAKMKQAIEKIKERIINNEYL